MWDVVSAVNNGGAKFEWEEVVSNIGDSKLYIGTTRDALRFNSVPAMTWHRHIIDGDSRTFNGVRVPATAREMQEIADNLLCMLPTPYILDLMWEQASLKFDPVINLGHGKIVATQNINDVHVAIEKKIEKSGGYPKRGIIASVGKYWCVCNELLAKTPDTRKYGIKTACNYGWHSSTGRYNGVVPGIRLWQGIGTRHNDEHVDPSQVIRLVYRIARLVHPDGKQEKVDLHDIAKSKVLSKGINHGTKSHILNVLRQPSVRKKQWFINSGNVAVMPELTIYGNTPPAEMNDEDLSSFINNKP